MDVPLLDLIRQLNLDGFLELVRQNSGMAYGLIFCFAAIQSMPVGLLAGYVVHRGSLDWNSVVLICWSGSFLGDAVRFWIGRSFGIQWLERFPRTHRAIKMTARLVEHHYAWLPFIHRFPHGVRNLAGFAYGASGVSASSFHTINFLAAGIWAAIVVSTGNAFGQLSEKMLNEAAAQIGVGALVAFIGLFWLLTKRLDRVIEQTTGPHQKGKSS